MSLGIRDLQLTPRAGGRETSSAVDSGDLEDVRLLDSYDKTDCSFGSEDGIKRIQVRVSGMTCAACSNSVEAALKAIDGVLSASVALLQNKADVVFNSSLVKIGLKRKESPREWEKRKSSLGRDWSLSWMSWDPTLKEGAADWIGGDGHRTSRGENPGSRERGVYCCCSFPTSGSWGEGAGEAADRNE